MIWGMEDLAYFEEELDREPWLIEHYGMPRRSGRWPYGSGENPYQHAGDFLSRIKELKATGMTDTEVAKSMGLTTSQFRTQRSLAKNEERAIQVETARRLSEKGYGATEIGRRMGGIAESTVRSLLNEASEARMNQAQKTADFLKKRVAEDGKLDVGSGVAEQLGVSPEMMKTALYILELEGYPTYNGRMEQVTNPGKFTTVKALCPPGTEHKEIFNFDEIHSVENYISYDQGDSFKKAFAYPKSMDSKRLMINYAEDGGVNKDGVIELRRGVADLDLGNSHYAQVRILVDGNRYLKGMAVYADDLPDGVDVRFNTNKTKDVPKMDVLKKIKDDPENPFGALLKERGGQSWYTDDNGKEQQSLINKTREEGDWEEWSDHLPAQFLSKQNKQLISKQLDLSIKNRQEDLDEILSLDNPVVKRELLASFASDCDSTAVHLDAAALPRQNYKVILPLTDIKNDEVYAPTYQDGEKVALIRFPHGGTFEIPILTVNNKNKQGKNTYGNALDAVGISKDVADRLSGADFDGDTVMVIPTASNGKNTGVKITSREELPGLKGFDPKMAYPAIEGMKRMTKGQTQKEMGVVSNLITDMTLKGANDDELACAVRHSMVVIDAEKHGLNYKQSEADNRIAALKAKYQGHIDEDDGKYHEGASTLISRAKSDKRVDKRKGSVHINQKDKPWYDPSLPEGAEIQATDPATYVNKKGETVHRQQVSTKMAETRDARTLSSGTVVEDMYANYANDLKTLANEARKASVYTPRLTYSPEANKKYASEVANLEAQYKTAARNAPRERQAQIIARMAVDAKKASNPYMTKGEIKKESQRQLTKARIQVGAKRTNIKISDREWEAIQAGAISDSKLGKIFKYVDSEDLRKRATPRAATTLSDAKINKLKAMNTSGYTVAEIAEALGVSSSTVSAYVKGKE
jgi:predicted transcriptional regulator